MSAAVGHILSTSSQPALRGRGGLAAVWEYRELLRSLIIRNLRVKYQRSALGFVWTLLNPVLMVAVLIAVFSYVVRIELENYWAFLISGFFAWSFVQQVMNAGTYVLVEHASLSRSIAFPKEILAFSLALSRMTEFLVEQALVLVLLIVVHHHGVPASFAILPVLIVLQFVLAVALELPIATLCVFFKDVEHAMPIALTALFYISPVFYPVSMIPEGARTIYMINPIAQLLRLYHLVLYEGQFPSVAALGTAIASILVLAVIGHAVFGRFEHLYAEIL